MVTYDNDLLAGNIIGNGNLPVQPKQARPKYKLNNTAGVARGLINGNNLPKPASIASRYGGEQEPVSSARGQTLAQQMTHTKSSSQLDPTMEAGVARERFLIDQSARLEATSAQQGGVNVPETATEAQPISYSNIDKRQMIPGEQQDIPIGNVYDDAYLKANKANLPSGVGSYVSNNMQTVPATKLPQRETQQRQPIYATMTKEPEKYKRPHLPSGHTEWSGKMLRHFDQMEQGEREQAQQGSQFQQSLGQKERGQQLVADTSRLRQLQDRRQQDFKNQLGLAGLRQKVSAAEAENKPKEQSVSDVLQTNAKVSEHYNGNQELIRLYQVGGANVASMQRVDNAVAKARIGNEDATIAQLMEKINVNLANPGA